MRWAAERENQNGGTFITVNTGSNGWNYQVKDLALEIQKILPGIDLSINPDAQPDKRSYRVSFDLFESLAPQHQPQYQLQDTVEGLIKGLKSIHFQDANYHQSELIRLNVIKDLLARQTMDGQLKLVYDLS